VQHDPLLRGKVFDAIKTEYLDQATPVDLSQSGHWSLARSLLAVIEVCEARELYVSLFQWFGCHKPQLLHGTGNKVLGRQALRLIAQFQEPKPIHLPFWLRLLEQDRDIELASLIISLDEKRHRISIPKEWKLIALSALIDCDPKEAARHVCDFPRWLDAPDYDAPLLRLWEMSEPIRELLIEALHQDMKDRVQNDAMTAYLALYFALSESRREELKHRLKSRAMQDPLQTAI